MIFPKLKPFTAKPENYTPECRPLTLYPSPKPLPLLPKRAFCLKDLSLKPEALKR